MTEALLALPPHLRKRLAAALESGSMPPAASNLALQTLVGEDHAQAIASTLARLASFGLSGSACAEWIRSIEMAAASVPRPDLVWSGPEVVDVHARETRRVYEELLGTATRSIWASTYVYFDGPRAFELLAKRMDAIPELRVVLLLNIQRQRGDVSVADDLVRRFADRLWKKDWPGRRRPEVFYDPRAIDTTSVGAVLHAKGVVADDESVFITSANLTEAALDRNIELGVVIKDRAFALSVITHFRALIEQGLLKPLPAN